MYRELIRATLEGCLIGASITGLLIFGINNGYRIKEEEIKREKKKNQENNNK